MNIDFMSIVYAVGTLAILGLIFGIILGIASKAFAVETDERIGEIQDTLPGANCGGCGFAGCNALATAIVEGKAKPNSCPVSSNETADRIAEIMGMAPASGAVRYGARVVCSGKSNIAARMKYEYDGVTDCVSAMRFGNGTKYCEYGCIGLGTCVKVCKFGAIKIDDGVAVVDKEKCVACGMCRDACPKKIIEMVPYDSSIFVMCHSHDKGAAMKEKCTAGCIGCRMCTKVCESGAITVTDNLAKIDYSKCTECGKCVEKCPKKIIKIDKNKAIFFDKENEPVSVTPKQ
ncbi:MAG: RnfABCDGE type electron transport complex subunit B [Clostridia bacterium]|nr:RnfABCDGE type electron transport complex subunit B [Clostridia bacterium]